MEATFRSGKPTMVDYTPSGADVDAGDVVVVESNAWIAHTDIADGALGALAIAGGVYRITKATGTGEGIDRGKEVYWDDSAKKATNDKTDGVFIGYAVATAGDTATTVDVYHQPARDDDVS